MAYDVLQLERRQRDVVGHDVRVDPEGEVWCGVAEEALDGCGGVAVAGEVGGVGVA